jgi:subtilisin family serine protease
VGNPITAPLVKYNKKDALVEYEKRFWHLMDLRSDSIAGMSVDRAHDELIKDLKGETVIVAVIDSGVDIDHPELKEAIWVNDDEIPNNRIDDDQNGYVDDVHGWNFWVTPNWKTWSLCDYKGKKRPVLKLLRSLKKTA